MNGVSENRDAIERIRQFVLQKFPHARKRSLSDSDNLLENGIVDSLGVLDLVTFFQQEFSIAVEDEDLTPDNFGSMERMAQFVERGLARQAGLVE